jgi:pimeloyl-ACP methyl ester carboxylesterase
MRRVEANGVEIACEITGEGPPIVLCHGGEADNRNFFNFAPELAKSFTVITYDQRDTGETRNDSAPYSAADLGRDVGALIEALGYERAHVFGTSFGGLVAQEAAINCPQRIDRLILSATWPGPEPHVTDAFYKFALSEKTPEETRLYWAMFFGTEFARAYPDEVARRMQQLVFKRTPEQRARRGSSAAGFDSSGRLGSIRSPTLILAGGNDRIVLPENPRKLARLIPGAELVILDGVGHATTLEAPDKVAAEIRRFVDQARDPAATVRSL